MKGSLRKDLRPLTDLMVGPRVWFGLLVSVALVCGMLVVGAQLYQRNSPEGLYSGWVDRTEMVATAWITLLPALFGKVAGDLDRELAWRSVMTLLPGRERLFARAHMVLAVGSVLLGVVAFQLARTIKGYEIGGGGAHSWVTALALATTSFAGGLWGRPRVSWGASFLWQMVACCILGYWTRPILEGSIHQAWIGWGLWLLAATALLLRLLPKKIQRKDVVRGPTFIGAMAGEKPRLREPSRAKFLNRMPPERLGGSLAGWVRAQRFALHTSAAGAGSWKYVLRVACLFVWLQFIPLGLPWFFGDKVGVRQDLVHALLGSSNLLTRDGLEIWILPDTAMGYVGIILAFLAAMPLLGGYYFPLSRHQRARLVFWNTVRYGLGGAVALVVVGCAVGYGLRALGEPIEVASVPLSLRLGLLFVAVFPLFVVVALKGISLGKPNLAFGLSILVGYALVKALRWVVDASHVLALGPGPLAFSYLGFSFLSYWACCLLIQHHFRRADLIPNPGTCS